MPIENSHIGGVPNMIGLLRMIAIHYAFFLDAKDTTLIACRTRDVSFGWYNTNEWTAFEVDLHNVKTKTFLRCWPYTHSLLSSCESAIPILFILLPYLDPQGSGFRFCALSFNEFLKILFSLYSSNLIVCKTVELTVTSSTSSKHLATSARAIMQ